MSKKTKTIDATPDGLLSEEVPPLAGSLAESLRAFSYSLPSAIADLVDNSISAGARQHQPVGRAFAFGPWAIRTRTENCQLFAGAATDRDLQDFPAATKRCTVLGPRSHPHDQRLVTVA
jgi:hypothetical protein